MRRMKGGLVIASALVALPAISAAQDNSDELVRINERFSGGVAARTVGAKVGTAALDVTESIGVQILNVSLTGGQKLEHLPVKDGSTLILQLRGGELITVIDGDRIAREEGEFWTVTPDQTMVLITEDDTAVISVTAIQSE